MGVRRQQVDHGVGHRGWRRLPALGWRVHGWSDPSQRRPRHGARTGHEAVRRHQAAVLRRRNDWAGVEPLVVRRSHGGERGRDQALCRQIPPARRRDPHGRSHPQGGPFAAARRCNEGVRRHQAPDHGRRAHGKPHAQRQPGQSARRCNEGLHGHCDQDALRRVDATSSPASRCRTSRSICRWRWRSRSRPTLLAR